MRQAGATCRITGRPRPRRQLHGSGDEPRLRDRGDAAAAGALPLDAAILFSDILTVPDAMGLGLSFAAGEGPRFARPVRDESDVARLQVPDMARLRYVSTP